MILANFLTKARRIPVRRYFSTLQNEEKQEYSELLEQELKSSE